MIHRHHKFTSSNFDYRFGALQRKSNNFHFFWIIFTYTSNITKMQKLRPKIIWPTKKNSILGKNYKNVRNWRSFCECHVSFSFEIFALLQFWYTTALFRSVKTTPKVHKLAINGQNGLRWRRWGFTIGKDQSENEPVSLSLSLSKVCFMFYLEVSVRI